MIDFYGVLGIKYTENAKIIHKAFIKKALQCHPDINHDPLCEEKFKKINEAYGVLSDKNKKLAYDIEYLKNFNHNHEFINKYSGENDKVYSNDGDPLNSYNFYNSKDDFSS